MASLNQILAKRRALSMSIDNWEMYQRTPNWMRQRMLAVNHFEDARGRFEIAEVLLSEAIDDGATSDLHLLSLLVNSSAVHPLELDMGVGKYSRPNEPGSIIFSSANTPSEIKGKGPFHSVTFYIRAGMLQERARVLLESEPRPMDVLHSKAFRDDAIEVLLKRLLQQFQRCPRAGQRMSADDLVDDVVRRLLVLSDNRVPEPTAHDRLRPGAVQRAMDYMHANAGGEITRDTLAQVAGVNPSHFTRLFRQTVGRTPSQYLLHLRIEMAKSLLRSCETPVSLGEIATNCGFYNQSHLGREFRRVVGTTPNMFRAYS